MNYYNAEVNPQPAANRLLQSVEQASFSELDMMARRLALADGATPDTIELLKGMGLERAAGWMRSSSMPDLLKEAIYTQIPGLKAEVERQQAAEIIREYENKQTEAAKSTPVWPYLLGGGILLWLILK